MSEISSGLYESIITVALQQQLTELGDRLHVSDKLITTADIADRLGKHIGQVVHRALENIPESNRLEAAVCISNRLMAQLDKDVSDLEGSQDALVAPPRVLRLVTDFLPDGTPRQISEPLIPLLDTVLLTNAPGEPRVGSQVLEEIESADRIDLIMAFIRRSGIRPLLERLRHSCENGKPLRVLTTTFTGTTEAAALDALRSIGAQIKVSYDRSTTRLHAKAWLFHRRSGFNTAYVGSSNLTHAGQDRGLEWNVRISGARNPDVVSKFSGVFESYWNNPDFIDYDASQFAEETASVRETPLTIISPLEIRLEPFQERLLERIALSRQEGFHRNLLVAATGTGKTVMAAVDYRRLRDSMQRSRLLFVAHREEILTQSLAMFRQSVKDSSFGELWVGGNVPGQFDHVFASIQSLSSKGLSHLEPDHFDIVIIDEFHHAAAGSYRQLLDLIKPRELLGLTATPERSDGLPILDFFGGRIAAELRLWDAIDQQRLAPFDYYGIHDETDLREVPWRRGRGYDFEALTNVLTANDIWAGKVIQELIRKGDARNLSGLGFCVTVEHARFMARAFNKAGIASLAIWADTPEADRKEALRKLAKGEVRMIFSVDLFNEGVDLPDLNTVLFLRPTDSPVLFLQQLGRGLRRSPNKSACLVLDFVGQHRREFRFDRRMRALLGGSRAQLREQIERGFPFLPAGCHMELDRVASKIILENLQQSLPSRWAEKVDELRRVVQEVGPDVVLGDFLKRAELEVEDVYQGNRSWSELREAAGLRVAESGSDEKALRRACGRLLHIDDFERIRTYQRFLEREMPPRTEMLSEREKRLLRMLVAVVADQVIEKQDTLDQACNRLWEHPQVRSELMQLFSVLAGRVPHLHEPLKSHLNIPLQVHARYSRIEIMAAFGIGTGASVANWQTGVYWAKEEGADLLAFTLDKTSGGFSPSTRYRDYAISRDLIHWESQSITRADGSTGQRYQKHASMGSSIMLFARENADERAFWFLGPADYVKHESERPMAITWRLHYPLPGDLFAAFAAAVA